MGSTVTGANVESGRNFGRDGKIMTNAFDSSKEITRDGAKVVVTDGRVSGGTEGGVVTSWSEEKSSASGSYSGSVGGSTQT